MSKYNTRNSLVKRAAMRKIGRQFRSDRFEHRLARAVLNCAVMDLGSRGNHASALAYLSSPMHLVDLCGVAPQWVRETLIKMGVMK